MIHELATGQSRVDDLPLNLSSLNKFSRDRFSHNWKNFDIDTKPFHRRHRKKRREAWRGGRKNSHSQRKTTKTRWSFLSCQPAREHEKWVSRGRFFRRKSFNSIRFVHNVAVALHTKHKNTRQSFFNNVFHRLLMNFLLPSTSSSPMIDRELFMFPSAAAEFFSTSLVAAEVFPSLRRRDISRGRTFPFRNASRASFRETTNNY